MAPTTYIKWSEFCHVLDIFRIYSNKYSLLISLVWKSYAPLLEVRLRRIVYLFLNFKNGSIESDPIYGLAVTLSKPKSSKNALAYIRLVLPMSPRLASATVKISE